MNDRSKLCTHGMKYPKPHGEKDNLFKQRTEIENAYHVLITYKRPTNWNYWYFIKMNVIYSI